MRICKQQASIRKPGICLLVVCAMFLADARAQEKRPNILLIVADDLGYTDMGAFGGEIPTPNLDALAYAASASPTSIRATHASRPGRCSCRDAASRAYSCASRLVRAGERANELSLDIVTMPEILHSAGYRTYMAGKWDLGLTAETMPVNRGFDRSFVLLEASSSHFAEYFWSEQSWYYEDDRHLELDDLPENFYATKTYTDKFLEYLDEHQGDDAPWFGFLAYTTPHWPLQVPDAWLDRHEGLYDDGYDVLREKRVARATAKGVLPAGLTLERFEPTTVPWNSVAPEMQKRYARANEIYASMVEYFDVQVGRIMEHLERSGQLDNTIVFFMSDHGASAVEIGILDGPTSMPAHFDVREAASDNSLENIGRIGSFVDRGVGFGEAATAPFRYHKGRLTEGGIRASAFVYYPAAFPEQHIDGTFITVMDLLPTFADIAGIDEPDAATVDGRNVQTIVGRSFWPYLNGEEDIVHSDTDTAGWVRGEIGAIIRGRYKLTNQPPPGIPIGEAELTWRLYDLEADPGEHDDLAGASPELVESLRKSWQQDWQSSTIVN